MNLTKKLSLQKPLMLLALIIIAAVSCPTFLTPSNIPEHSSGCLHLWRYGLRHNFSHCSTAA